MRYYGTDEGQWTRQKGTRSAGVLEELLMEGVAGVHEMGVAQGSQLFVSFDETVRTMDREPRTLP